MSAMAWRSTGICIGARQTRPREAVRSKALRLKAVPCKHRATERLRESQPSPAGAGGVRSSPEFVSCPR